MEGMTDILRADRQAFIEEKRAWNEARQLAGNRSWLTLTSKGRYICLVCDTHHHTALMGKKGRGKSSKFLLRNGGVEHNRQFSDAVAKHENTELHFDCLQLDDQRQADPISFALAIQTAEAKEVTGRVFRTLLDNTLHYRAFLQHEALCFLQRCNGLDMGDRLHSDDIAPQMLTCIYNCQLADVRKFLSTPNEFTKEATECRMCCRQSLRQAVH